MQITHHTQLLNALIEKHNLKSYLEIGVQNHANNFDKIKCKSKVGVDPEIVEDLKDNYFLCRNNSDSFFEKQFKYGSLKADLIFIDGLHHADQVKRDFENSLKCLTDNGFIIIHDCLPEKKETTIVPRNTRTWHGDVYKFCMSIRNHYSDIRFITFNIDNGCMLVWKEPNLSYTTFNDAPFDWDCYLKFGKVLMNVVDEVTI